MNRKYVIGIDNGGTFSKAALFDEYGTQISAASEPTVTITPKPGYTERDMEELWLVNVKAIRKAIEKSNINPGDIVGASFAGHGKGLYLVGYDGKPSYPGIISTDTRAWEQVKHWYETGIHEQVYKMTYQQILACQPVSLLAWLKSNHPEVLHRTQYIFSVKDYIRYKMTGEAYADYTDFTGANLVNLNTGTYDRKLLALFGLEELYEKLPPLRYSTDVCGTVTEETSRITKLPVKIPVAAGMFDVDACGIASGLSDEHHMCMVAGTWSINEFIAKQPVTNGTVDLNSMFCIPGYYLIEESSPTSAGNMEWFIRNLMEYEKREAGSQETSVYEGVVFSHMTHVQRLLKNRSRPERIRLSGGAANSRVWVQIFADVLQIPIDIIDGKEPGALGAAMAAGIAAGLYEDFPSAIRQTVHITETVYPREEYKLVYEQKFKAYQGVIHALSKTWSYFEND